ncbi:MAG TPA: hypothetical protein VLT33_50310 [Labilithrix sp.]|nr:hypothetical protein [Labilithrix sp.]
MACSSSEESASEPSPQVKFCDALTSAYAKCGGSSCGTAMNTDCTKLAGIVSPSILGSATTCIKSAACGTEPLGCLGAALGSATPSAAQTSLATSYCDSCSVKGGEVCTTAFFGSGDVPGLATALLPFGDGPLTEVESACTKSALGKTACQAGFTTCLSATTTKFLAKTISVDSAKCLLEGITKSSGGDGGKGDGG